ncbi:toll/interleukin-1 receptor domain-containing protein [Nocardiopsis mangrovi]|uniref:Toll/interleukin-1 receptor domain-containing protein n=1 Tax=Nocardiopsis mangrovi TaxID=1179818 RepID=A0ABV9E1E3_9ACTN
MFVSYSRREFYIAEAMAATLRLQAGLDPWFDVERLRPGMDWAAALDDSLERAGALLLLASPAALASEHVRREWTRALERGVPLHIGVVEAVELPAELAGFPVHDLRTRFFARAPAVAEAIARGATEPAAAPAPRPGRLGIPARVPAPIAAAVALSVLTAACLAWTAAALVHLDIAIMRLAWNPWDDSTVWEDRGTAWDVLQGWRWTTLMFILLGMTAFVVPLAPSVLVPGTGLLRRRTGRGALAVGFLASTAVGALLLVGTVLFLEHGLLGDPAFAEIAYPVPPHITDAAEALTVPVAGTIVFSAAGAAVAGRSRTLHLWSPTGTSADFFRAQVTRRRHTRQQFAAELRKHRAVWTTESAPGTAGMDTYFVLRWALLCDRLPPLAPATGEAVPATVAVMCTSPVDAAVADHIRWACRRAGMAADPSTARHVLVLVGSHTPWPEATRQIEAAGPRAICVLLDTIRVPPDAEGLRRRQWLDFRERRPETLFDLLSELRSPETEGAEDDLPPVPTITDRFLAPITARWFVLMCRSIPAFFVGFSLVGVALRPFEAQSTVLAAVTVLLALCFTLLGTRVAQRRTSTARFRAGLGVISALLLVWSTVAAAVLWIPIDRSSPWRGEWSAVPADTMLELDRVAGVLSTVATAVMPSASIICVFALSHLTLEGLWILPRRAPGRSPHLPARMRTWNGFWPFLAAYGVLCSLIFETHVALA